MLDTSFVEDSYRVSLLGADLAPETISTLLNSYRDALVNLLMAGTNYSLITLKALHKLYLPDVDLAFMDTIDLSRLKAWRNIEIKIKA